MKTMSAALKAHYALPVTTLATCLKITQKSGLVLGFTDASQDITYGGVTYKSAVGYTPSNVQTTDKLNVDNLEVTGILSSPAITDADLISGAWNYAQFDYFQLNYMDLTMGVNDLRTGFLGIVGTGRHSFQAELRGLMQALQQDLGRVYLETCDADFCDARCGLNAASFTSAGAVTAVSDNRTFTTNLTQGTGIFSNGKITFTSGLNNGISMEVRKYTNPGQFVTQLLFPFAVAVGDTFSALQGCPKTIAACNGRFNNGINNRSFFLIPGNDRLLNGT